MRSTTFRLLLVLSLPALAACDSKLAAAATGVILQTAQQVLASASPYPLPSGSSFPLPSWSPSAAPTAAPVTSTQEQDLYNRLMQYRAEKGLPAIPLSSALTTVARTHVADLLAHPPDGDVCNLHSWSTNGPWTAVCYTDDHAEAEKMWSKPRELTSYPGNGYEIALYATDCSPEVAMDGWKGSSGHNSVMVNEGTWSKIDWKAVGVGINAHYAVVWFGEEAN